METIVYNPQYDFIGILNEETGLIRIEEVFSTKFMVYLEHTWFEVGEL